MFFCQYWQMFESSFFYRITLVVASAFLKVGYCILIIPDLYKLFMDKNKQNQRKIKDNKEEEILKGKLHFLSSVRDWFKLRQNCQHHWHPKDLDSYRNPPLPLKVLLCNSCVDVKCSVKKLFLKISQNSQENTSARVSFLIKLQVSDCNFIKKETLTRAFFCEFCEILWTLFSHNISGGCFWFLTAESMNETKTRECVPNFNYYRDLS